jgi:hypothetical protein
MPKIANKVINYNIYGKISGSMRLVDNTTKCQLPSIEYATDTIKGAGILGEIDFPSLSNIGPMAFSADARVDSKQLAQLSAPQLQEYEVRWSVEKFDSASGRIKPEIHKAILKGMPKKYDGGAVETGASQESSIEIEVLYYKRVIDGEVILEVDKLNQILKIGGVDYSTTGL